MAELALSLVVIRAANLEQAQQFYAALGLCFVKEQHGRSPEHYAATIDPTVFEIYPREPNLPGSATTRLGFRVPSLDATLATLTKQGAAIVSLPKSTTWGRQAVVLDPDGHRVELCE